MIYEFLIETEDGKPIIYEGTPLRACIGGDLNKPMGVYHTKNEDGVIQPDYNRPIKND